MHGFGVRKLITGDIYVGDFEEGHL